MHGYRKVKTISNTFNSIAYFQVQVKRFLKFFYNFFRF